jgi:hypothetical protein
MYAIRIPANDRLMVLLGLRRNQSASLGRALGVQRCHPGDQIGNSGLNGYLLFQIGAILAALMGSLGLALAAVGVYGVISYTSRQRTHEIGVRMVLDAQPAEILN